MIKLIALDMDGTITQHKSHLDEKNRSTLEQLKKIYNIVIVGAGTCDRINKQLELSGIDIIGSYGMQQGSVVEKQVVLTKNEKVAVDNVNVINKVEVLRERFGYKEYKGDSVEFHETGMVTIPLLGTKADLIDKLAFDPERVIRREFYRDVVELFPEYTVFIGGTSSFDMAPAPFNKLYALEEYAKEKGFNKDEIIYIGDDYGVGGNDEQVYRSAIDFITIDNYQDFSKKVQFLL